MPPGLRGAVRLARRFALAYAAAAYRRRVPSIAGESLGVRRALAAAATRVPPARRGLRPRLLRLRLALGPGGSLTESAWIDDGRFPSFSVAFTVSSRDDGWIVTSFEAPD